MKIERVVFDPTREFIEHLKKQGINYQIEYNKRYPEIVDNVSFIETEDYKIYREHKGLIGLSQIFRELGKKKWQVQ